MIYPLVRDLADDGVPVTVTCRVLKIARQPYCRWLAAPVSDAELDEAWLANAIFDAHRDDPEFGYRFLADEVRAVGHEVSDRVVWRICRDMGWWSVFGKPKAPKTSRPGTPAHDDLVRRRFRADGPNEIWVADLTEHRTGEGKVYLCAIKDLWSNRIVGWAIDERMKARLVVAAIDMAVARRDGDVAGCIFHSDRGSQFRARKVHRALARHGLVGSMGQVGSAGDNAAMESFFALLQRHLRPGRRVVLFADPCGGEGLLQDRLVALVPGDGGDWPEVVHLVNQRGIRQRRGHFLAGGDLRLDLSGQTLARPAQQRAGWWIDLRGGPRRR